MAMGGEFTLKCRAIKLRVLFPHSVGAAKGMVGALEHVVRPHDCVGLGLNPDPMERV